MDRQTRVVLYLAGWLLVTSSGCASWSAGALQTAATFESTLSLARLSERHGEAAAAEQVYQAVLVKDPQNQDAHHRLAVLAIRARQYDQAQHHFDQARAGTPNSQLLSDLGYFLYLTDKLPEAEAALRQSLELDPGNAKAHNNLGLVLGTMNRLDESLAEFRFAGDEAAARGNLAYVHSLNGDFEKSKAEYHQALQLNSQLKPAAEALLALHAHNDPNTAAALACDPTIHACASDKPPLVRDDRLSTADLLSNTENPSPAADQADPSPSQVVSMSFTDKNGESPLAYPPPTAVEKTRPLMNLPAEINPAPSAEPSTSEASTDQQATQAAPSATSASMSLPSPQPQPWQMPTWTAHQAR